MKQREGYLQIDHRSSPGLTEQQAETTRLPPQLLREGKMLELATLTCSHCKTVQIKNPLRTRERAHCPECDHYICDLCGIAYRQTSVCRPWAQVVEDVQSGRTPVPVLARPV
jgi:hypothetical protein